MSFLKKYHYPGNIRELKNIIERLIVLAEGSVIHFKNAKRYLQSTEEEEFHNLMKICEMQETNLKWNLYVLKSESAKEIYLRLQLPWISANVS